MGGSTPGASEPCPGCSSRAGAVEGDEGFVCLLCGMPRVLLTEALARSGDERPHLERARSLRLDRAAWGVAASVAAAFAGLALVAGAAVSLLADPGVLARAALSALVIAPLLASAFGFRRVSKLGAAARSAMEEAELVVLGDVQRARGSVDARALAELLGSRVEHAERLLLRQQVERLLEGPEPPKLRVEPGEESPEDAQAAEGEEARRKH